MLAIPKMRKEFFTGLLPGVLLGTASFVVTAYGNDDEPTSDQQETTHSFGKEMVFDEA